MYLLDTNICIFIINKKSVRVLDRLNSELKKKIYISSITVAELQFGVCNSRRAEKNRIALLEFLSPFQILNFDDQDAEIYGQIRSKLKSAGKLIGPYDMLIAAQALSRQLTLVTNNVDEFNRIPDLQIEDWN